MADRLGTYAVLAEFREPAPLIEGAKRLRAEGWRVETFTPFPVEGLADALGFHESKVPIATLIGGVVGAATGFLMQVFTNLDFPLDIGGRPLIAVPAFLMITFELMVLFAVFAGIGTMLVANRLPRLHHPLFAAERFGLANDDRFFLALLGGDEDFDAVKARAVLSHLDPMSVVEVSESDLS